MLDSLITVEQKRSCSRIAFICTIRRGQSITGSRIEEPTVIEASQPRVRDVVLVMRRGIASRAAHGGNPRQSTALSGRNSMCRETSLGPDMERERRADSREGGGKAKTWPGVRSFISEMRCDEPWRKKKKNRRSKRQATKPCKPRAPAVFAAKASNTLVLQPPPLIRKRREREKKPKQEVPFFSKLVLAAEEFTALGLHLTRRIALLPVKPRRRKGTYFV